MTAQRGHFERGNTTQGGVGGYWRCARCKGAPEMHAWPDSPSYNCVYAPELVEVAEPFVRGLTTYAATQARFVNACDVCGLPKWRRR